MFEGICTKQELDEIKALAKYQYTARNLPCFQPFVSFKMNDETIVSPWVSNDKGKWAIPYALTDEDAVKVYGKGNVEAFIRSARTFFETAILVAYDLNTCESLWKQDINLGYKSYYSYFDGYNGNEAYLHTLESVNKKALDLLKRKGSNIYISKRMTKDELKTTA